MELVNVFAEILRWGARIFSLELHVFWKKSPFRQPECEKTTKKILLKFTKLSRKIAC